MDVDFKMEINFVNCMQYQTNKRNPHPLPPHQLLQMSIFPKLSPPPKKKSKFLLPYLLFTDKKIRFSIKTFPFIAKINA